MKFHQEEERFRPVTITLESEDEVQLLLAAIGGASIAEDVENTNFIYDIYKSLRGLVSLQTYVVDYDYEGCEIRKK